MKMFTIAFRNFILPNISKYGHIRAAHFRETTLHVGVYFSLRNIKLNVWLEITDMQFTINRNINNAGQNI